MSNFVEDCINGDAIYTEIDRYISYWHEGDSELQLPEFLGMTVREYALFVEDESYLGMIINAHISSTAIDEVVESLAIAARSDNQAKSKRIEHWLKDEGLWD
jgi:hypothetical protein